MRSILFSISLVSYLISLVFSSAGTFALAQDLEDNKPIIHIDRKNHLLHLLDSKGKSTKSYSIGTGKGGMRAKKNMSDLVTPTGDFTVDLILSRILNCNAISEQARKKYEKDEKTARIVRNKASLSKLLASMNRLDFDKNGKPDNAYGKAYVGLTSDSSSVTGPKLIKRGMDYYWYSIALHGTPLSTNLGKSNSGGCIHLDDNLLESLIENNTIRLGSRIRITDTPP